MKMQVSKTVTITERKQVEVTENQLKVIKDKYLKDAPTVEAWLENIAENIALAELLYHPDITEQELFEGINYKKEEAETFNSHKTKTYYLHYGLSTLNEQNDNFAKFVKNLHKLKNKNERVEQVFTQTKEKFYNVMANWEFLPNSPTLMNAGRVLQQLSACFVIPVPDTIDGIYDAVKAMAIIQKTGGGTGFSFSRLRPANDIVLGTKGVASGPLSFMSIFDRTTDVIKQGSLRRGANMAILRYDHPDIMKFITCKRDNMFLENFNISVAIDKKFMHAVKNNEEYNLINPRDGSVAGKLNAREVFESMCKNAWGTGDPGFVVIDRINETDSNPTPKLGQIESTNPCGEKPLLPWEPCNLASINLSKFVDETVKDMDWERLRECVYTAIHFLENVIDVNNYPLPQIEMLAKGNRRIGLGVMGFAETLAILKIPYNSEEGFKKGEEIMKFINEASLEYSIELAKDHGVFPNWKDSIFDPNGPYFREREIYPRHCVRTTIAPTGTIAITAGLQGSGIEPFFAIVYVRYNAAGIDALRAGKKPLEKDTFYEINPLFKKIAEKNNFFGLGEKELWDKIEKNHKSLHGIKEIPEQIQKIFITSHDLNPMDHVRMQAAFQKYTDDAVSKTVNLRHEATIDDVREVYMRAYEMGCKGVTIYRDGSKTQQVLNLSEKKVEEKSPAGVKREKSAFEMSSYYLVETGHGPLHLHINYDQQGPTKVFANISPAGTDISGLTCALAIVISKYLGLNGDPVKLLKHLNSIKGDRPFGFGPKRVDSIPHGIAKALRDHLVKTGKMKVMDNGQTTLGVPAQQTPQDNQHNGLFVLALHCPKCYSTNVEMVSGCTEPTCFDCGYSKCS